MSLRGITTPPSLGLNMEGGAGNRMDSRKQATSQIYISRYEICCAKYRSILSIASDHKRHPHTVYH